MRNWTTMTRTIMTIVAMMMTTQALRTPDLTSLWFHRPLSTTTTPPLVMNWTLLPPFFRSYSLSTAPLSIVCHMCSHIMHTKTWCIQEKKATEFLLLSFFHVYFFNLLSEQKCTHDTHTGRSTTYIFENWFEFLRPFSSFGCEWNKSLWERQVFCRKFGWEMVTPFLDFSISRVECNVTGQVRSESNKLRACAELQSLCAACMFGRSSHSFSEPCTCVCDLWAEGCVEKYAPLLLRLFEPPGLVLLQTGKLSISKSCSHFLVPSLSSWYHKSEWVMGQTVHTAGDFQAHKVPCRDTVQTAPSWWNKLFITAPVRFVEDGVRKVRSNSWTKEWNVDQNPTNVLYCPPRSLHPTSTCYSWPGCIQKQPVAPHEIQCTVLKKKKNTYADSAWTYLQCFTCGSEAEPF